MGWRDKIILEKEYRHSVSPIALSSSGAILQKAKSNLIAPQTRSRYCVRARETSIKDHNYKLPAIMQWALN